MPAVRRAPLPTVTVCSVEPEPVPASSRPPPRLGQTLRTGAPGETTRGPGADPDERSSGPTADSIVASLSFAPQAAKILAPLTYLTVAQVAGTLTATGSGR